MVHWLYRRGQQLLLAKFNNADWQDWYIYVTICTPISHDITLSRRIVDGDNINARKCLNMFA